MIIGYELGCYDNDSHMFIDDDPGWPRCLQCGFTTDFDYFSPMFELKRKNFDIAATWDGRYTVSLKFKEFCLRHNYTGLEFRELPNDPGFFKFGVHNIIPYDTDKKHLNFHKYCDCCLNYQEITPASPIFLKGITAPLGDGFYATDIRFASGNAKSPVIIISVETYIKLKKEQFKGIYFKKILYPYEFTPLPWMSTGE